MYLKPVKVSSDWKPYFSQFQQELGKKQVSKPMYLVCLDIVFAKYHPKKQPTTLPCSDFQLPCASGTATAKRSASGSFAMINSAFFSFATLIAKSNAPFLLDLGNSPLGMCHLAKLDLRLRGVVVILLLPVFYLKLHSQHHA